MKLRKTTATLLILLAIAMIAPMAVMASPIQDTVEVWWLEDATRCAPDGTVLSTWFDNRIPTSDYKTYIEFAVHGKSYHALDVQAFYNYYPLENFESSSWVIANGKFAFWAKYTSVGSGLPILDKMRGRLTIEQETAYGSYVQYSYVFGTAEDVLAAYSHAVETDESGMWYLGPTYYEVHGQE